jgi:hypothetical protein
LEHAIVTEFEDIAQDLRHVNWDVHGGVPHPTDYVEKWGILVWDKLKPLSSLSKLTPRSLNQEG